jgi:hypothetical protein
MTTYQDVLLCENIVERYFAETTKDIELVWHRDRETRVISPIEETNWKIQLEDQLPQQIVGELLIEKGRWHRLIKGDGDLILKIIKHNG